MKSLVLSLVLIFNSYSFAGVLPFKAQQSLEDADTDLVLTGSEGMGSIQVTKE